MVLESVHYDISHVRVDRRTLCLRPAGYVEVFDLMVQPRALSVESQTGVV